MTKTTWDKKRRCGERSFLDVSEGENTHAKLCMGDSLDRLWFHRKPMPDEFPHFTSKKCQVGREPGCLLNTCPGCFMMTLGLRDLVLAFLRSFSTDLSQKLEKHSGSSHASTPHLSPWLFLESSRFFGRILSSLQETSISKSKVKLVYRFHQKMTG